MKKGVMLIFFLISFFAARSQVGINTDGTAPDGSAMLDVKSAAKGILVPRLTDAQRDAMVAPAIGLLIFNTTTNTFNVYKNSHWYEISNGSCVPQPSAANAGPDQSIPVTTTTLAATPPAIGTGSWSVVSGTGGSFGNAALYNSSFTGSTGVVYVLRWTVSNGCSSTTDDVTISITSSCSNGYKDGPETDVDCGGGTCPGCPLGKHCLAGSDCSGYTNAPGFCYIGICVLSCTSGYANCNGNQADGCETDTRTSRGNCGGCAIACGNYANSTSHCVNSSCEIVCSDWYANCNNNIYDGCETDLHTAVANCGTCGNNCLTRPNVTGASCSNGQCLISSCAAGYGNCDGQASNGCETNLASSATDCGGCGIACPIRTGATSMCYNGVCGWVCLSGRADCNALSADGCETDLTSSATNCGSCGNACPVPAHGAAICASSLCDFTCNSGYHREGNQCIINP